MSKQIHGLDYLFFVLSFFIKHIWKTIFSCQRFDDRHDRIKIGKHIHLQLKCYNNDLIKNFIVVLEI